MESARAEPCQVSLNTPGANSLEMKVPLAEPWVPLAGVQAKGAKWAPTNTVASLSGDVRPLRVCPNRNPQHNLRCNRTRS